MTTVADALARGQGGCPLREREWLLAHVLGWSRTQLLTHRDYPLTAKQQHDYAALLAHLAGGEPLAYLLGRWEFWSLDLVVTRDVLIPRPETELLVEVALARIPVAASWDIADLGTGSGAVALAVASERPSCLVTAIDCSASALAVAEANARRLGLSNVTFLAGDWCVPLSDRRYSMILANPPYLVADDPHLAALRYEPLLALAAGADGLAALRAIVSGAVRNLCPGGTLLLEHGYDQGASVRELLVASHYEGITTLPDLEGRERVTLGVHT